MTTSPGLVVQNLTLPLRLGDFRLIAFDMDSTLINIECIDEIAAVAGKKAEVAAITEAAMRGDIADFKESLRRRLALLQGVSAQALQEVYTKRLLLNPGAAELLTAMKSAGLATLLVSGGFTYFAERVQRTLGIDRSASNVLEIEDGLLTGRVIGDIVDGAEKQRQLLAFCAELGCSPQQAIAMGDGANDLPMMGAAGLSVAYHAKPKVRAAAHVAIDTGGLDRLLDVFA